MDRADKENEDLTTIFNRWKADARDCNAKAKKYPGYKTIAILYYVKYDDWIIKFIYEGFQEYLVNIKNIEGIGQRNRNKNFSGKLEDAGVYIFCTKTNFVIVGGEILFVL